MAQSDTVTESPKDRLLAAAVDLFAESGFAGSSVRDLARKSGMSLAGVYHHFASKDEILFEIQKEAFEQLLLPLASLDPELPALGRLEAFVRNHISFFSRKQTKMKLLSHELSALKGDRGSAIAQLRGRYHRICFEAVSELLKQNGRTDLDARVATMCLFGMINWIYRWYPRPHDPSPDELARQMLDLFQNGVAAPKSGGLRTLDSTTA